MCNADPCARQTKCDHNWDTTTEIATDPSNPADAECADCGAISV